MGTDQRNPEEGLESVNQVNTVGEEECSREDSTVEEGKKQNFLTLECVSEPKGIGWHWIFSTLALVSVCHQKDLLAGMEHELKTN